MTIYGRAGDVVTVKRRATLADIKRLESREPDTQDLEALENDSYVVVLRDDGREQLYHLAYMRATNGLREIHDALDVAETENLAQLRTRLAEFESTVLTAERALEQRGKGGQQVSFHGDFAGATPGVLIQIRRWVRFLKGED